ncbi:arylamine N-acetyltransferase family protein [Streptomyces sp. NPDC054854]
MTSGIRAGYLRRLGITDPGTPSAEGLFALQRAHLERVPYENLDIQLGRPPGIDPELSARRIAAGRGGYCFHLNGAFALLLETLGYEVTRHVGGVMQRAEAHRRDVSGDHLALTVRVDGQEYLVETGLGDGPYEPLPLRAGAYERDGTTYRLEESAPDAAPGWTYLNDGASAPVMNFLRAPASTADFEAEHTRLSTSEDSGFVRTCALLRRDEHGVDALRGRVLSRVEPGKPVSERELTSPEEFFDVIASVFDRKLDDFTPADRSALWTRVSRAHESWLASRRG